MIERLAMIIALYVEEVRDKFYHWLDEAHNFEEED